MTPPEPPTSIRIEAAGQAWEAPLPDAAVVIGTAEGVDLRLQDGDIGPQQCRITPLDGGGHLLRDLGADHPTTVNGVVTQQARLRPGDRIEVGSVTIVYAPEKASARGRSGGTRPASASTPGRTTGGSAPRPAREAGAASSRPARSKPGARTPRGADGGGRPEARRRGERPPAAAVAGGGRRGTRGGGSKRLTGGLLALGAAAVGAILLAVLLGRGGGDTIAARAERRLDRAVELIRADAHAEARSALLALLDDHPPAAVKAKAERYLGRTRTALQDAEDALARLETHLLDLDESGFARERSRFLDEYGAGLARRFDRTVARMREARKDWRDERIEMARLAAEAETQGGRYGGALRVWTALAQDGKAGVSFEDVTRDGAARVEAAAEAAATRLLEEAAVAATQAGPDVAAKRLRTWIAAYEGTAAHARLAAGIAAWERKARDLVAAGRPTAVAEPRSAPPTAPTGTGGGSAGPDPLRQVLADVDVLKGKRAYRAAALLLADALEKRGGASRKEAEALHEDLALAAAGLDALARDIPAHREKYRRIEMGSKFFVSLEDADLEGVTGAVRGARTRYRWSNLPAKRLARIVRRMKAEGEDALAIASLLRELGDPAGSDRHLVRAVEGGVEARRVFVVVARWRDEALPDGGYVAWKGRYVTLRERDRLAREEKIEGLAKAIHAKAPTVWKAAAETLLGMGDDGRARLQTALGRRRTSVLELIAGEKELHSTKTKQRLHRELTKRRTHALVLIEDAGAWPYPNPDGRMSEEVVRRVNAVREIWDDPFGLVVSWSKKLEPKMNEVAEIDAFLERADPQYEPDIDAIAERVNLAIDMPAFTPDSKSAGLREYSLKVLAYNEQVTTTATREEKDCVRAVNEYRMMMGRNAVKIHERLVRAARGHSRHMREHGYFAHDVPAHLADAKNRSPGARAKAQGYGGGVGENIARGSWSGRDAFRAWFHSSGHHRNMIAAGWTEMGAGRSGGTWWTQLFGRKTGRSLNEPDALEAPPAAFAPEPEDDLGRPTGGGRGEVPRDAPPGMPPPSGDGDGEPEGP